MHRRLLVLVVALAVVLVAAQAASTSASRIRFRANLFATTHSPHAGDKWSYTINVRNFVGVPIKAVAKQFIFHDGHRIDTIGWNQFKGTYRRSYRWPTVDRGKTLVFVAKILGPGGQKTLTYTVHVK
jgi:hypothetical protein